MPLHTTIGRGKGWRAELSLFLAVYIVYNLARWIVALEQSAGLGIAQRNSPPSAP